MGCGARNKKNRSSAPARASGCGPTPQIHGNSSSRPSTGEGKRFRQRKRVAWISDFVKHLRDIKFATPPSIAVDQEQGRAVRLGEATGALKILMQVNFDPNTMEFRALETYRRRRPRRGADRKDRRAVGQAGGRLVHPRARADPRRQPRRHPASAEDRPRRRGGGAPESCLQSSSGDFSPIRRQPLRSERPPPARARRARVSARLKAKPESACQQKPAHRMACRRAIRPAARP
jgi:hypothetical protein